MQAPITPYERMEQAYKQHAEDGYLQWLIQCHALNGFVFIRPDLFLIGRPVTRSADTQSIIDPRYKFDWGKCDAWYVHACSGNMARAFELMPFQLPFIAMERLPPRKSVLRFYRTERIGSILNITQP